MIIPDIDDLVLECDGETGIEELGRRVLARGTWTSIAFLVRTRRTPEGTWEGPFLWLHRYRKMGQGWQLAAHFHTTDPAQLQNLLETLADWKPLIPGSPAEPS